MALVVNGYSENKLGSSEVNEIRKLITQRILDLSENGLAPAFIGTLERDGYSYY